MNTKKIFCMLLSAGLVVSLLAGCGGNEKASIAGEGSKPKLKALQMYTREDVNNHVIAKLLEERTGYSVEYETLSQDKPYDKLNLLLAGGESYDVVSMGNNKNVYAKYAANGALNDLEPLLKEYGKNLLTKISQQSYDILKVNDKNYGIPNTASATVQAGILIRMDWLDKLELDMPTTVEEFTNVLRAFKEKDPAVNQEKNVPFVLTSDNTYIPNLQGAFGLATDWQDIKGELVSNVTRPEFVEYLQYVRSIYKEGLIDREFAVYKAVNAKEKFTSGQAGAIVLGWFDIQSTVSALRKIDPNAQCAYIPVLSNSDGRAGIGVSGGGVDKIIFIPKSSQNPEHAVKWLDAKLEDETFKLFTIGEEGVHYEIRDGSYYPIQPIFFDERNAASIYLTGVDEEKYPQYWQARIRKDPEIFDAWYYLNNDEDYKKHQMIDTISLAPYIENYSENIQTINALVNDFMLQMIVGDGDIGRSVNDFINKWLNEGGESIEESINAWYKSKK